MASPSITRGCPLHAVHASIAWHLAMASALGGLLLIGVGGWAQGTMISGAVIASGQLVVESDVKKVQHPTGGVIGQLLVREGDRVKAGDVLIRLDATQVQANLDIVLKTLDELSARRARGEAERDGTQAIAFPAELEARRASDPAVAHLIDGEIRLFRSRLAAREGQKSQLRERIAQFKDEIRGQTEQSAAKDREILLIQSELKGVRTLYEKNLVPLSRVTALERDAARLQGERGQLLASAAATRGKITETELQVLQIDQDMRTEVGREMADIRSKWSEYIERRVSAEDQLKRIDMRAPQSGTVHQMTVHTVGGLVSSAEPAMLIVPEADHLVVEVKIQPQDIDSVRLNQRAILRFPAFNQRTTPEIEGGVSRVSADVSQDPKSGVLFYLARIAIDEDEVARLGPVQLIPGMPVEAHIQLGERTALSYLLKPLSDQLAKTWKEK